MYIYQWRSGFSAARGEHLVITELFSCKPSDNGIDKIKSKQELIEKYSPCVSKAHEKIPQDRKRRTYIFLAATAGMRLLDARNKTASDQIFNYAREYFRTTGFLFKNDTQARIITGQEEGADAWISANYFENNFAKKPVAPNTLPETKGILDLGGASTQIVFVPRNPNQEYKKYFTDIRILGKNYRPYSYSFLCWGMKEITQLYQTSLITRNNYRETVSASCFPVNARFELTAGQIRDSPCANGLLFNNSVEFTADPARIEPAQKFSFLGQSNPKQCAQELEALMPQSKCKYENGQCSFYSIYQPPIEDIQFLGFSAFFFSRSNTERLLLGKYDNDLEEFRKATNFVCSKTYPELVELNRTNNAGLSETHLKNLCFGNMYSMTLTSKYGFIDYKNFKVTDKINGFSLNWALGYLINELNRDDFLPYEEPPRYIRFPLFLGLALATSFLAACFLIYILHKKIRLDYKRTPTNDPEEAVNGAVPITIRPPSLPNASGQPNVQHTSEI